MKSRDSNWLSVNTLFWLALRVFTGFIRLHSRIKKKSLMYIFSPENKHNRIESGYQLYTSSIRITVFARFFTQFHFLHQCEDNIIETMPLPWATMSMSMSLEGSGGVNWLGATSPKSALIFNDTGEFKWNMHKNQPSSKDSTTHRRQSLPLLWAIVVAINGCRCCC